MEELEEIQQDILSRKDGLEGINGTLHWCVHLYVLMVDSEFFDDIIPTHHYDSEAPLVHSTPAIVV